MDVKFETFRNWSPIRLYRKEDEVFVDWCYLGDKRLTEPFHDQTIDALWQKPFNLLFRHQTPINFLGEMFEKSPGVEPKGFIFHISRCGSTLVSQMLASLEKNIVVSEPLILDKTIRFRQNGLDVPEADQLTWLRWVVNGLSQRRFEEEENFFIKFDSWAVLDLPLIKEAFPDVPWIFVYRNPIEVIVSQLQRPGAQMIPGAVKNIFPNLSLFEILQFSKEEYYARTIAAFCEAGLANSADQNGKFINYHQLPEVFAGEICDHFNLHLTEAELEIMNKASGRNAKVPQISFVPDTERKKREAGEQAVYFTETILNPLYEKLEQVRLAASARSPGKMTSE